MSSLTETVPSPEGEQTGMLFENGGDSFAAGDQTLVGFRLQRLEVLNWGTFDRKVWTLHLNGHNTLLTGDIGSGKSTLVDAITTLLVPTRQIAYNKAAGADGKERNLLSYVRGYHKTEREESGGAARPAMLREGDTYTVLLGVFSNAGYNAKVTLAQVLTPNGNNVDHIYVIAEKELSIAEHFGAVETIKKLKNRLRAEGAELPESFQQYFHRFHQFFGITRKHAMLLFNQTVSMKSVGNLTDFVRTHMLEPADVEQRITAFIDHFDNLNRAHESVLRAKDQIGRLTPLVAMCDQYQSTLDQIRGWEKCRSGLEPYFAQLRIRLLDTEITELERMLLRRTDEIAKEDEIQQEQIERADTLKKAIQENGGDALEKLTAQITRKTRERDDRCMRHGQYAALVKELGLQPAEEAKDFRLLEERCATLREEVENDRVRLENERSELNFDGRRKQEEQEALNREILSLKARRSNIDSGLIDLRKRLCQWLEISEEVLPFAGELIRVMETESEWEGAAERVLHSFGLALLVPDQYYSRVQNWVDQNNLRSRFVYFHVRKPSRYDNFELHPNSLVHKLEFKHESPLREWLHNEVKRRFDFACCDCAEDFQLEERALSLAGQTKEKGGRHEKDDRHDINNRARYVLGWTNQAKIRSLEDDSKKLGQTLDALIGKLAALKTGLDLAQRKRSALDRLQEYREFSDLDWRTSATELQALQEEKTRLEQASDQLGELRRQYSQLQAELNSTKERLKKLNDSRSRESQRLDTASTLRNQTQHLFDETQAALTSELAGDIGTLQIQQQGERQTTQATAEKDERALRDFLQSAIDREKKRHERLRDQIVTAMKDYATAYPQESREVDTAPESADEFRQMLQKLRHDDLPRFEEVFKNELNTNTIREVVSFQHQLENEHKSIGERIRQINQSLIGIDYNPSRYIRLELQPANDQEISQFRLDLKACTTGALTVSENEQYSEEKFRQVKLLIERLRGRKDYAETDRRWKEKVTDVRQWYAFAASERWRENDQEHEHYSDSGGKSGGQKEKLAYTVLAASLAYQFGIEWNVPRSRTFHFAVIDEAFGRGSDESTRYGLELFKKLNLQLMIITPLQKISIIEPYISSVGLVHNKEGSNSTLRNLTIEELQVEKERYHESQSRLEHAD